MQAKRLVATDTIHAIPVSLFGGLSYLALGLTNLSVLALLLLGSVPAAIFGAKLAAIAPVHVTRTALGFVLCLAGLKLLTS
jgi:uncharacterized protein